jgi:hypothetical protein
MRDCRSMQVRPWCSDQEVCGAAAPEQYAPSSATRLPAGRLPREPNRLHPALRHEHPAPRCHPVHSAPGTVRTPVAPFARSPRSVPHRRCARYEPALQPPTLSREARNSATGRSIRRPGHRTSGSTRAYRELPRPPCHCPALSPAGRSRRQATRPAHAPARDCPASQQSPDCRGQANPQRQLRRARRRARGRQ